MCAIDRVISPKEGVSCIGINQHEASKSLIVVDGEGQDYADDNEAREKYR
jgi:hypothetical protein